jgi:hypothetical protein
MTSLETLATLKAKVDAGGPYASPTEKLDLVKSIKVPIGDNDKEKVSISFGWQTAVNMEETYIDARNRLRAFVDTSLMHDVIAIKYQDFLMLQSQGLGVGQKISLRLTREPKEVYAMLKSIKRWYGLPYADTDAIFADILKRADIKTPPGEYGVGTDDGGIGGCV